MKKKYIFIVIILSLVVFIGYLQYSNINNEFSNASITKKQMRLNKEIKENVADWTIKKVKVKKNEQNDEYEFYVYMNIKKKKLGTFNFRKRNFNFIESMWINPLYYGANQTNEMLDERGRQISADYWKYHSSFNGSIIFTLPTDRVTPKDSIIELDILIQNNNNFTKYYLPISKNL
ncbi:hypothetical protein ETZ92_018155 [Bacillus velezensis]|uniref:hypothetical protein n=1 Tax=Bacillus velezensis TaxID=492670 RepID=UPI000B4C5474|nr:hypothetical protein [Bacillus velezensis]OWP59462.1 hypothetical protein CEA92_09280 [Bacillus velezensis]QEQ06096.1 hypothetical protein ETZ92_018155 [Bacillus velezensis]